MSEEIKKIICGGCANHCSAHVRVKDGKVLEQFHMKTDDSPFQRAEHTIVSSCTRARSAAELVYHPQRLNYPLKRVGARGENKWQRVTWEEALDSIASRLKQVTEEYGVEAVAFASHGGNNCGYEFQRRFMHLFGSPTFPCQGQICFTAAIMLNATVHGGIDYFMTLGPESELTKCMLLIGINPRTSWRHAWYQILELKKRGMKLIVIDPRVSEPAAIADIHLQPQPATDTALLLAMLNVIIKEDLYDKEFVNKYCYGFDKLAAHVEQYTPEWAAPITGVPAAKIREATLMYASNKPGLVFNGMGLEMVPYATDALLARFLLPAVMGNVDIPGGQYIGESHPTVRLAADIICDDAITPEQKAKLIGGTEFPFFSWNAFDTVYKNMMKVRSRPFSGTYWLFGQAHFPLFWRAVLTGKPYTIKALLNDCSEPLMALPNTKLAYQALKKVEFSVNIDIWMTPSALLADYVLPAACYLEKPYVGAADYVPGFRVGDAAIAPLYERKPEYAIWRELGLRLGQDWPWKTLEEAYDHRLEPLGLTFKQAVEQHVFTSPKHFRKHEKIGFGTPTGKLELYNTTLEGLGLAPLPLWRESPCGPTSKLAKKYPLTLISGRNIDYSESQHRQLSYPRRKNPDPIAEINPVKAKELGINDGDWIWIETKMGRVRFKCRHFSGILPNVVKAEKGWWFPEDPAEEPSLHGLWKSNLNAILDDDPALCDPASGAWVMRAVMCKVYKDTTSEVKR